MRNISPDPKDEYFADGMTEELISTMSKISGLKIIARTSVMRYKAGNKGIDEIARELNVGTVLEGSVRKAGEKLRITVQLINSETSDHIWSESYDRELKDVLAIQSDISKTVAEALKVQLLSKEEAIVEKRHTVNSEAYALYLKGRFYWNERTKESVNKAMKYFEQAIQTDSVFAPACSGLADCYNVLAGSLWMPPSTAYPLAMKFCKRALEIDDNLAEAHASLGWALVAYFWDFDTAGREFNRAIELSPNYATVYHWYSLMMFFLQNYEEAYSRGKRALELDPLSRVINTLHATYLASLGRIDEAMERFSQTIDLNPDYALAHFYKSAVYVWLSEYDAAIEEAFDLDGSPLVEQFLAWAYASAGKKDAAQKILNGLIKRNVSEYVSPVWLGMIEISLGRLSEGYDRLEKSLNERNQALLYFRGMPWFKEYRSNSRWKQIDQKIGLPKSP